MASDKEQKFNSSYVKLLLLFFFVNTCYVQCALYRMDSKINTLWVALLKSLLAEKVKQIKS